MPLPLRTHLITRSRITINTPPRSPVAQNRVEATWFCTLFSAWLWPFSSSCWSSLSRFCDGKTPIPMDTPWHRQVRYIFSKLVSKPELQFPRLIFQKVRSAQQWNLIHCCCLKWPFSFHIEVVYFLSWVTKSFKMTLDLRVQTVPKVKSAKIRIYQKTWHEFCFVFYMPFLKLCISVLYVSQPTSLHAPTPRSFLFAFVFQSPHRWHFWNSQRPKSPFE